MIKARRIHRPFFYIVNAAETKAGDTFCRLPMRIERVHCVLVAINEEPLYNKENIYNAIYHKYWAQCTTRILSPASHRYVVVHLS